MLETVQRPLWRGFSPNELRSAVRHARGGGIAVVKARSWQLLGDAGARGEELPLFVDWAIRAVEAARWAEITEGPARGLVQAIVVRGWRERVNEWIARDAAFAGPTAAASFDCVKCGACCHDNRVVLDAEDLARWKSAKRADLLRRTSRTRGLRLLPLVPATKACVHLQSLMCSIYEHRPNMCRDFPIGTEHCMTSREDMYGNAFPEGR